jgi:hypothetical protein
MHLVVEDERLVRAQVSALESLGRPDRKFQTDSRTNDEPFATFLLPNSVAQDGLGRSGLALTVAEMQINWAYLTRGDMD